MTVEAKTRKPVVAALLSVLLPGLGQLYAGRLRRGLVLMAIGPGIAWGAALHLLPADQLLWVRGGALILIAGFVAVALFGLAAIVDAYRIARRAGGQVLPPYQRWYVYLAIYIAVAGLLEIADSLRPRSSAFPIASAAMVPTLLAGDRVFGARYQHREPQRGDLAVYLDEDETTNIVRRIVGLPGDRIELRGGRLYLNGELVPREPVEGGADNKIFLEALPGDAAHLIAEIGDAERLDDADPVVLPADHYFMLGDNRDNSRDSRMSGPISRDRIVSRVFYVYWSWNPGQIGRKPN